MCKHSNVVAVSYEDIHGPCHACLYDLIEEIGCSCNTVVDIRPALPHETEPCTCPMMSAIVQSQEKEEEIEWEDDDEGDLPYGSYPNEH